MFSAAGQACRIVSLETIPPPLRGQDGDVATPVPRAGCAPFCERPILAEIRGRARESREFVFLRDSLGGQDPARAMQAQNP